MGALGNVIGKAIDTVSKKNPGTTLQDFLSHFSSSDGKWINTIDPFSTFDVRIKFYPMGVQPSNEKKNTLEKLGDLALGASQSAVKNFANNITGGLIGSIMNGQIDIVKQHDTFDKKGKGTFLEYLAAANMLVGQEDWIGENAGQSVSPLEIQLGLYCQEVTVPNIEIPSGGSSVNSIGEFPINGLVVKTDSNILKLKIVNTKVPLHERIFYPWLREVTLPYWSYETQPYTTATITVDFTKHNDIQYVFCGCRPMKIIMQQATQEATSPNITRDVDFLYDYMFINSTLTNVESVADKLLSTGKTLLNGASKMLNM